jgi:cell division transport system permease protein
MSDKKNEKPRKAGSNAQLAGNKRLRRRWITWTRMVRYGVNNFTRNLWLTTAATAVMTITLLIIFTTFVARYVLNETVTSIRQRVDIPVNLRSDVTDEQIAKLRAAFESRDDIITVNYVSAEEAKQKLLDSGAFDASELELIAELPQQPYYPTLNLVVKDPTDTQALEEFINTDSDVQAALNTQLALRPDFGDNNQSIETISNWASMAETGGLVAGAIFVAISMLIIFNTIRMAIFSRKDEIEMMKLIGADKGFIRGPFVVEAVMYGFFAALFATGLGVAGFIAIEPALSNYGISTDALHSALILYSPVVFVAMVIIGSVIGVVSSRLAVRRYLKLS